MSSLMKARSGEDAVRAAALFRLEKLNGASMRRTLTRAIRSSRSNSLSARSLRLPLSTMQTLSAG